jgi:hypothetical protein
MTIIREDTNTCVECGQGYWVKPYRRAKSRFCSQHCAGAFRCKETLNVGPKPWAAANLDGHRHKSTSRFPKGHKPWNFHLKGIHLSPETEFKPGRNSEKTVPVGTVSIRNDKNGTPRAHVKTEAGWELRARLVYMASNGEIPSDKVIHHIDGNSLNDDVSNLVALTRAEHIAVHRADISAMKFIEKPAPVKMEQGSLL